MRGIEDEPFDGTFPFAPHYHRIGDFAMLRWSRDIPMREGDPSYAEIARIERGLSQFGQTPTLLIRGMNDLVLPPAVLR